MKAKLLLFALVSVGLFTAGCPKAPPPPPPPVKPVPPPPPTFQDVSEEILAAWFKARPVNATALGDHTNDGAWPDLSPEALTTDRQRIDTGIAKLDEVLQIAQLGSDDQIDADILRAHLELQIFEHEIEQPWTRNPMYYATLLGTGLDELVSRDFAPLEQRAAALAQRLAGVPTVCEQATTNLDAAQMLVPHANVAVGQLDGIVELIRKTIPERIASAPEETRGQVGGTSAAAIQSIRALQKKIRDDLPNAQGDWRLGAENFERKLELTMQSGISAGELRRVAVVEHGRVRKRMAGLASELANVLFTKGQRRRIRKKGGRDADTAMVRAVLDRLADHHVSAGELRDAVEENLTRLNAFVDERGVVTRDSGEVLKVIWTPPHQRGVWVAGLAAPGPLDAKPGLPSFYLVQPVSEDGSESYLREYNNFMLEILSIHEAIPGHFIQLYFGKREESKVRRVLQNGAFVEGWAVYAEKVMVDEGYPGVGPAEGSQRPRSFDKALWTIMTDPDLRAKAIALHQHKFYLRTVTNAILDHAIHSSNMTREDAIELMVQRSYQQESEAAGKWVRAQVSSTQLSTYFVGAQAWLRLRAKGEARARETGQEFDMKAFHDQALAHGAPPVQLLPLLMGWEGPAAEAAAAEAAAGIADDVTTPVEEPAAEGEEEVIPIEDEPEG